MRLNAHPVHVIGKADNMKLYRILSLCVSLTFAVLVAGCDMHIMDGWGGGGSNDSRPDASDINRVQLSFSTTTVTYDSGSQAEVAGVAYVDNHYGDPLADIPLSFCISDDRVEILWRNPNSLNFTDGNGRVEFTLRSPSSAGPVSVVVSCLAQGNSDAGWVDGKSVLFIRNGQWPTELRVAAVPETLYADNDHPDSTSFQATVLDNAAQPIPGCNVYSLAFREIRPDNCNQGWKRTNAQGVASAYHEFGGWGDYPYHLYFLVRVADLVDSFYVTVMPWDSTHGG